MASISGHFFAIQMDVSIIELQLVAIDKIVTILLEDLGSMSAGVSTRVRCMGIREFGNFKNLEIRVFRQILIS